MINKYFLLSALFSFSLSVYQVCAQVMTYSSSTVTQNNTNGVLAGSTDPEIIGIHIVTTGVTSPLAVTDFALTLTFSTSYDIDGSPGTIKIWSTGNSSTFSTGTLFGSNPGLVIPWSPLSITITGNQTLLPGTNYFWLSLNIPSNAPYGDIVDAQCSAVRVAGAWRTPTVTNPAGSRKIDYLMSVTNVTTNLTTAAPVVPNTVENQVIKVEVTTLGGINPLSITNLSLNTSGLTIATNPADIANAKLSYTGITNVFSNTPLFGSVVAAPNGAFSFSGNQTLPEGTCYFWLMYDVKSSATLCNAIDASCTQVTIGGAPYALSFTSPGKGRTINNGTNCPLTIAWDKTIGGSLTENLRFLSSTSDGGYILGGYSNSGISGDKTEASRGGYDYWIVKLNSSGTKLWDKRVGSSQPDYLCSVIETSDGYLLGGISAGGQQWDKTAYNNGAWDYWILKMDNNLVPQWDKTFGGDNSTLSGGYNILCSMKKTSDGGFILSGYSSSQATGNKATPNYAVMGLDPYDGWGIKIDEYGNKIWEIDQGGTGNDFFFDVIEVSDGYVFSGVTNSGANGNKTTATKGDFDYWIVKTDLSGTVQWERDFGGSGWEGSGKIIKASGSNLLLFGNSNSSAGFDKSVSGTGGWALLLDANGNKIWDKIVGPDFSAFATQDGGFIFAGMMGSSVMSWGGGDYNIVKTDANGDEQWDRTFGGTGAESMGGAVSGYTFPVLAYVLQTADGGYVVAGTSSSNRSGEKSEMSKGGSDFWVLRLHPASVATPVNISSLKAIVKDNAGQSSVILYWQTAQEVQNDYFEIQRSKDGKDYASIGNVDGSGTTGEEHFYSFRDENPFGGISYYRLRQVDYDGQISYSKSVEVFVQSSAQVEVGLIYPNPVLKDMTFTIGVPDDHTEIIYCVYDMMGRKVSMKTQLLDKGITKINVPFEDFPTGTYVLKVNGKETRKFVNQ